MGLSPGPDGSGATGRSGTKSPYTVARTETKSGGFGTPRITSGRGIEAIYRHPLEGSDTVQGPKRLLWIWGGHHFEHEGLGSIREPACFREPCLFGRESSGWNLLS